MEEYFTDKANIFLNQTESDVLVLGEQVAPFVKEFGYQNKIKSHTEVVGANNVPKSTALKIPGQHNRYNAALAAAAAEALGVDGEIIKTALESFEGVEGRLQFLKEVRGVKIYNDTNSTTPDAAIAGLQALDPTGAKNIVLLTGGTDKLLDMSQYLAQVRAHAKAVFLLAGSGTERIKGELPAAEVFDSLPVALAKAWGHAESGDILLFSPAFTSFGMFKNEYDRGDQFVAAVQTLT